MTSLDRARPLRRFGATLAALAALLAPAAISQVALAPAAHAAYVDCNYSSTQPTLVKGTRYAAAVKEVQCILNVTNSAGLAVDGAFGNQTETAVKAFQARYVPPADGVVGSRTWAKLQERYRAYVCQRGGPC